MGHEDELTSNEIRDIHHVTYVCNATQLKCVMQCMNESMRLYPHRPVLLQRAKVQDVS